MDDRITKTNPHVFRTYPGINELSRYMIDLSLDFNPSSAALFYIEHPGYEALFQKIFIPTFDKKNITVIINESFSSDNVVESTRNLSLKVKNQNPDILIVGSYYNAMENIFKVLKQNKIYENTTLITEFNLQIANNLNVINDALLDDVYLVVPAYGLYEYQEKSDSLLISNYYKKYEEKPNYDVAFAYDALIVLAQAIGNVGIDNKKITNYMKNIDSYHGMSGKVTIDTSRNWQTEWVKGKYVNGKFYVNE